jgi:hypothetical protein
LQVQAAHAGVAERGTLLGVAVDLADGVVDIKERDLIRTGEQARHPLRESGQEPCADLVELLDVAVGEGAQERAQRRGRTDTTEQTAHTAVAQQIHVVDGVGAGEHPADHARGLH